MKTKKIITLLIITIMTLISIPFQSFADEVVNNTEDQVIENQIEDEDVVKDMNSEEEHPDIYKKWEDYDYCGDEIKYVYISSTKHKKIINQPYNIYKWDEVDGCYIFDRSEQIWEDRIENHKCNKNGICTICEYPHKKITLKKNKWNYLSNDNFKISVPCTCKVKLQFSKGTWLQWAKDKKGKKFYEFYYGISTVKNNTFVLKKGVYNFKSYTKFDAKLDYDNYKVKYTIKPIKSKPVNLTYKHFKEVKHIKNIKPNKVYSIYTFCSSNKKHTAYFKIKIKKRSSLIFKYSNKCGFDGCQLNKDYFSDCASHHSYSSETKDVYKNLKPGVYYVQCDANYVTGGYRHCGVANYMEFSYSLR